MVRRRVQDADQIARAEADGDQGVSDQGHERTQLARDLLAYLQSTARPPLLRATLAVAVAALRARRARRAASRPCGARSARSACTARPASSSRSSRQHLPGQRARARGYDDVLTRRAGRGDDADRRPPRRLGRAACTSATR